MWEKGSKVGLSLVLCAPSIVVVVTKSLIRSDVSEERFILAYDLREYNPTFRRHGDRWHMASFSWDSSLLHFSGEYVS